MDARANAGAGPDRFLFRHQVRHIPCKAFSTLRTRPISSINGEDFSAFRKFVARAGYLRYRSAPGRPQ